MVPMSDKPTSAAQARDAAEQTAAADALAAAFGGVADLGGPTSKPDETTAAPSGPAGPPGGPPSGPPRGPPGRGPPSGPPAVKEHVPEEPPEAQHEPEPAATLDVSEDETPPVEEVPSTDAEGAQAAEVGETAEASADVTVVEEGHPEDLPLVADAEPDPAEVMPTPEPEAPADVIDVPATTTDALQSEETAPARAPPPLAVDAEVRRLRGALATAQATIEALDEPQVPPAVLDDIVVPQHVVADIARMGRWMVSEDLARGVMGGMAMLHPDHAGVVVATRMLSSLPRLDERSIVVGRLGAGAPRGARDDWRLMEVLLASVSVATGGPAAVLHAHGPYTTAMSCEKDLVVQQPLDELGKKHIGRIIIVDRDPEDPESFLRMAVEALQQGGMRCIVVRGHGAYAVGADLTQAWANASMVEHSMRVALLARQAGLKT